MRPSARPEADEPTDPIGAAAVAETTYTPFQSEPDAAPVRLIVGSHARFPTGPLRQLITAAWLGRIEATIGRHAEIVRDLKYGV